jgi:hypothetical protein
MGSFSVRLALDDDGYLRRECPSCERQFKWHHGPTEQRPHDAVDPANYFCPLCGQPSAPDDWWTPEQAEYAKQAIAAPIMDELGRELKRALRPSRGSHFGFEVKSDPVEPPSALHEINDMVIVEPPCHPWEPIKVPSDADSLFHCLVCGQRFTA